MTNLTRFSPDYELSSCKITGVNFGKILGAECRMGYAPFFTKLSKISGWSDRLSKVNNSVRCFWTYRDELSINNENVLKGEKVVVSSVFRNDMQI